VKYRPRNDHQNKTQPSKLIATHAGLPFDSSHNCIADISPAVPKVGRQSAAGTVALQKYAPAIVNVSSLARTRRFGAQSLALSLLSGAILSVSKTMEFRMVS
jgi:hypothetical protein